MLFDAGPPAPDHSLYSQADLTGSERNQRRQIAISLRGLFKNEKWLGAHTVEGSGGSR